jgi:hypothetical protein
LAGENNDNSIGNGEEPEEITEADLEQIRKSFRTKRIAIETMLQEYPKHAKNATKDFDLPIKGSL